MKELLRDKILDSIPDGVFAIDKDFKINFFNQAAEEITGFKRKDVIGKYCKHIFRSESCFSNCPIAAVLQTKENIFDQESRICTASDEMKSIRINASIIFEGDSPIGGIVTFRDLNKFNCTSINYHSDSHFHGIIGHSKQMKDIYELITEIADSNAPVFITGESGTGKELIANAIQKTSNRNKNPYIKINCSVLPANLLASELFGHVKGSFTDAVKDRPGRFELADKGTIFLDEVAEMPLQTQIHLLRILQEGTFERVGESITRTSDVRVIAATNIDIEEALESGKFREDLFYRLNVIPIEIPPLRNRKEDIIPLSNHFLKKFSNYYNKEIVEFESGVFDLLLNYHYPGNVRELENILEYAFVRTTQGKKIEVNKLPKNKLSAISNMRDEQQNYHNNSELKDTTELISSLEKNHWNKNKTAEELQISRTTLWRKMKSLGLKR
ncbi:MAG: sigma 54-interacting transcriptional regulator [Ignavibacteriaceae bacterium]|jgi:PAS domain S-box-containing protein|nr:sigma 54-interacting transcriptional regulator [Ignavibacteriaceae bacterium]